MYNVTVEPSFYQVIYCVYHENMLGKSLNPWLYTFFSIYNIIPCAENVYEVGIERKVERVHFTSITPRFFCVYSFKLSCRFNRQFYLNFTQNLSATTKCPNVVLVAIKVRYICFYAMNIPNAVVVPHIPFTKKIKNSSCTTAFVHRQVLAHFFHANSIPVPFPTLFIKA